jgi:hypothetical protein
MPLMRKLSLFFICAVILVVQSGFGAEAEKVDVILGTNGSVVKGKIIERIDGKKITVVMSNGQRVEIPFSKISEITTSDTDYEKRHREILDSLNANRKPALKITDQIFHVELNIGGDDTSNSVSLTGVGGVMTSTGFSIGLGTGWDQHDNNRFLPIFGEIGYYLTGRKWTPYMNLQAGYSVGWLRGLRKSDYGGVRWGIGIGLQRAIKDQLALTILFSYNQQAAGHYSDISVPYFKWISGSLGLRF